MARVVCWLPVVWCGLAGIQMAGGQTTAAEVLERARAALGGTERLATVRSLSFEGVSHSKLLPGAVALSKVSMDFLLPDSFLRQMTTIAVDSRPVRVDPVRTGMNAGSGWGGDRQFNATVRNVFRRWLLLLTLQAPGVTWKYGGPVQLGDDRMEMLEAAGEDGFAAQLYVNAESGLPVMLSFRMMAADGPPPAKARERQASMRVREYTVQDGIRLPSVISNVMDGVEIEKIEARAWRVNPPLDAKHFRKR